MGAIERMSIPELLELKDQVIGELCRKLSDARCNPEINNILQKIFELLPECNGFVLGAAYRGDHDERWVFGFDEVEESAHEGSLSFFPDSPLQTVNWWITNHGVSMEVNDLLEKLAEICPYPIEEEYDWQVIERGQKVETLVLNTLEYV